MKNRRLNQKEDEYLMELELQLDSLNSLLKKNEAYSNKLRTSLSRIEQRHTTNKDRLISLYARKDELKKQTRGNNRGNGSSLLSSQAGLNSHKIQGVSFYALENYERLDCIQAFELMNKKKIKDFGVSYYQLPNLMHGCAIEKDKMDRFQMFFQSKLSQETLRQKFILFFIEVYALKDIKLEQINWVELAVVANTILSSFKLFGIAPVDGLELFSAYKNLKKNEGSQDIEKGQRLTKEKKNITDKLISSEWTAEDDESLKRGVCVFGEKRWGQVATLLNGKEHTDMVQRWQKQLNPQVSKGRWSMSEDIKLCILFEYYGAECQTNGQDNAGESKVWCLIASKFQSRTEVQIRERWCNLLNPALKFTHWSPTEDSQLLRLGVLANGQWAKISRLLSNKTDNQVLRRWKLLLSDKHNVALIKHLRVSNILEANRKIEDESQGSCKFNDEMDGSCEMEMEKIDPHKKLVSVSIQKRKIFKSVSLKPCLANQIRKDNLHRSQSKKHKQRRIKKLTQDNTANPSQQYKIVNIKKRRQAVLTSTSGLDNNSSTIRSRIDEEDDDESIDIEEISHSSITFTDYPSALVDPLSNSYSNQQSLKTQHFSNKFGDKSVQSSNIPNYSQKIVSSL